jgi:regulation of enolase protein 1 (concanavalin A-like superfamily)
MLDLERRDLPSSNPTDLVMPLPTADVCAVGDCDPQLHQHGTPCSCPLCVTFKSDPADRATGPFLQPPPAGFQLQDGGNAGAVYSPFPITYSTTAAGLPILNSSPSSPVAIYLDFDGEGSNTPYDVDGNPGTFNAAEQATIVECWRQIAVYYSMYDVNVTTIYPAGMPMCWQLISNSISGGYAYVGAFPNSTPRGFNQSSDARNRVSGIAHEVGHNFALSHQSDYNNLGVKTAEYSSGYELHGPLMGVDYAQLVHKFIIGHPSYSASALQDDLALIAAKIAPYQPPGGDGYRPDDVGNTTATALPMLASDGYFTAWGIIERPTDVDVFSFTSVGGVYGIYGNPNTPSSLDAKMEIYDGFGVRLATVDHVANNEANVVLDLPAGQYYVMMSSRDDYADLGAYQLSVRPLPTGWSSQDIGTLVTGGYAGVDSATGTWRVGSSGTGISSSSDGFRFAYTPLNGNGSITARVTQVENTNSNARAGVMIRETLAANSRQAFMGLSPSNAVFAYRTSIGGSTSTTTNSATTPYWVRLTRTGNSIVGQISSNGTTWTTVSTQTISMATQVFIGLAVTSANNTHYNQVHDALFTDISTTGTTGPTAPTFNSLSAPDVTLNLGTGTNIVVNWTAVPGATGYEVYRSDDGVSWGSPIATVGSATTSYTNTGLLGGRRHFYIVQALDGSTRSVPSDPVSALNRPSPVTNFSIAALSTSQLVLNWRETNGETGYRIERSTDGGANWTVVGTVGKNVPSYSNSGLAYNQAYSYRVIPLSALGDGPASSTVTTTTRLNAVTGLAITAVASNQIDLNWNAVTGATGYRIERSNDGTTFSTLTTVTTPGFSNTGLSPLTKYYYRVAAVNAYTESASYPVVFAATSPTIPLSSPWSNQDVGAVGGRGAAGQSGSTFTVIGSGGAIGGTSDAFHFVNQPFTGDGSITARVNSMENLSSVSFAGIMIRESLNANSRSAFVGLSPTTATGLTWVRRTTVGGTASATATADVALPEWVRLTRAGNVFTAERSDDGSTWITVGSTTIAMGSAVFAGLAVVSGDNSKLAVSSINSVNVVQTNLPPTVLQATPSGSVAGPVNNVELQFTTAMNTSSFSIADDVVSFTGPAGNLLNAITGFTWVNPTTLRVNFNAQGVAGQYALTVGPNILSTSGIPLDQDGDGTPGELIDDRYVAQWTIGQPSDGFGYVYKATTFDPALNLNPNANGVVTLTAISNNDDQNTSINLGANVFRFYGQNYTGANQLYVSSNGLITLGSGSSEYQNDDLTTKLSQGAIAPLWDDLVTNRNTATNDLVLYQFQDLNSDGIQDRLVINWRNVHYWQQSYTSGDDGITFQAVLELNTGPRSGDVIFNYVDLSEAGSGAVNNAASATAGIKDIGVQGDNRVLLHYNGTGTGLVSAGQAVRVFINRPPVANIGGPYVVGPNGTVQLNGLGSSDPDQSNSSLNFLWDLDGDGIFGETGSAAGRGDENVSQPIFQGFGLSGPMTIALRVIDEFGLQSDATTTVNLPPPAQVTGVAVNDGSLQRSRVNQLTVFFDRVVTLPAVPNSAFSLFDGTNSWSFNVNVTQSGGTTVAVLDVGELTDGNYTLTVFGDNVTDVIGRPLDGNANGTPGGNYVFQFHRLFGDVDGDRTVSALDFNAFRQSYGTSVFAFDFDGDGLVNAADFNQFRTRYGVTI